VIPLPHTPEQHEAPSVNEQVAVLVEQNTSLQVKMTLLQQQLDEERLKHKKQQAEQTNKITKQLVDLQTQNEANTKALQTLDSFIPSSKHAKETKTKKSSKSLIKKDLTDGSTGVNISNSQNF